MYEKNVMIQLGAKHQSLQSFTPKFAAATDFILSFNRYHTIGFWELNTATKMVNWSKETFQIHGLDRDEGVIPLANAVSFYVGEDMQAVNDIIKKAIISKQGFHFKQRIRRTDGEIRVVESIGDMKTVGPDNELILFGTVRDVTNEVRNDNIRTGQKDLIERLIKSLPIPALITNRKLEYISVNERFLIDFNLSKVEIAPGFSHHDMFPAMPERWKEMMRLALSGQPMAREKDMITRPNGVKYLLDWVYQPWTGQSGEIGGLVILMKVHRMFPPIRQEQATSYRMQNAALGQNSALANLKRLCHTVTA